MVVGGLRVGQVERGEAKPRVQRPSEVQPDLVRQSKVFFDSRSSRASRASGNQRCITLSQCPARVGLIDRRVGHIPKALTQKLKREGPNKVVREGARRSARHMILFKLRMVEDQPMARGIEEDRWGQRFGTWLMESDPPRRWRAAPALRSATASGRAPPSGRGRRRLQWVASRIAVPARLR